MKWRIRLATTLFGMMLSSSLLAEETLRVGVHHNYKNDALSIGVNNKHYLSEIAVQHCPSLDSPRLKNIQRITMELVIICNAVRSSSLADKIQLIPFPNTLRGIDLLNQGHFDIIANSMFASATKDYPQLNRSQGIIRQGEFVVGLFTTENRFEVLNKRSLSDFRQLKGVTVLNWVGDIRMMKVLKPKDIVYAPRRDLLAGMIENKRADFTFSYLSEEVVTRIGGKLVRIPNVKASFLGDRAFAIAPDRQDLLAAINQYLAQQRNQTIDQIRQAFIHAGFITTDYDRWLDLTIEAMKQSKISSTSLLQKIPGTHIYLTDFNKKPRTPSLRLSYLRSTTILDKEFERITNATTDVLT